MKRPDPLHQWSGQCSLCPVSSEVLGSQGFRGLNVSEAGSLTFGLGSSTRENIRETQRHFESHFREAVEALETSHYRCLYGRIAVVWADCRALLGSATEIRQTEGSRPELVAVSRDGSGPSPSRSISRQKERSWSLRSWGGSQPLSINFVEGDRRHRRPDSRVSKDRSSTSWHHQWPCSNRRRRVAVSRQTPFCSGARRDSFPLTGRRK